MIPAFELKNVEEAARYWLGRMADGRTALGQTEAAAKTYISHRHWRCFVCNVAYPTPLGVPATDMHWVFFKKFLINQFDREFHKGAGVRLVYDGVKAAADKRAHISVVLPAGEIYACPATEFLTWAEQHAITDASWAPVKEATYPSGLMRRLYPA